MAGVREGEKGVEGVVVARVGEKEVGVVVVVRVGEKGAGDVVVGTVEVMGEGGLGVAVGARVVRLEVGREEVRGVEGKGMAAVVAREMGCAHRCTRIR